MRRTVVGLSVLPHPAGEQVLELDLSASRHHVIVADQLGVAHAGQHENGGQHLQAGVRHLS